MKRTRSATFIARHRPCRSGFLLMIPLREILVVCLFIGLIVVVIFQTDAFLTNNKLVGERAKQSCGHPVQSLGYDADRETLFVQSWSTPFKEISLHESIESSRETPPHFFSFESSEINSTIIMMSQTSDGDRFSHGVHILRYGEEIVAEGLVYDDCPAGDVRISSDGRIAVFIGSNGMLVGWDLTTEEPIRWEYRLADSTSTNKLSPDGHSLLNITKNGSAAIYDVRTGAIRVSLPTINACSRQLAWSKDNRLVALADLEGMLFIFDAKTGLELWRDKQFAFFARVLRFSSDNRFLVVGGFDKMVWLWDWSKRNETPRVLVGSTGQIGDFLFTDAGQKLVVGCTDGTIREWSMVDFKMKRQIR